MKSSESTKIEKMEAKIKELEAKVRTQDDIEQIEKLQRIYGYYLDNNLAQEIVDLFSDNTESIEVANRGVYLGKSGVWRFFLQNQAAPRPDWVMGRHLQLQGVVNVDPGNETAKGRWQCLFMFASDFTTPSKPSAYWGYGVYENEYIKENNKWLFKKMHFNRIFFTPYEDGWVKTPDTRPDSIKIDPTKPDLPPTAYHPYPEAFIVPFHYKHPVTGK
jgi:hypothetical protein